MKPFLITSMLTAHQLYEHWQRHLPFLKLRIYKPWGHLLEEVENDIPLMNLGHNFNGSKWLLVDPDQSVSGFEREFCQAFGLRVEVLRRTGYTWAEIDCSRYWSLQKQNRKGEQILVAYHNEF